MGKGQGEKVLRQICPALILHSLSTRLNPLTQSLAQAGPLTSPSLSKSAAEKKKGKRGGLNQSTVKQTEAAAKSRTKRSQSRRDSVSRLEQRRQIGHSRLQLQRAPVQISSKAEVPGKLSALHGLKTYSQNCTAARNNLRISLARLIFLGGGWKDLRSHPSQPVSSPSIMEQLPADSKTRPSKSASRGVVVLLITPLLEHSNTGCLRGLPRKA